MKLLSRIPRALILGFLLLLIPVGAVLAKERGETGSQPESNTDAYKSHDDLLKDIGLRIPDFGGMYLSKDNSILNVYVLAGKEDVLDTEEVKQAIEGVLKADAASRRELRLIPAQYSMAQLYGWYKLMQDEVWAIPSVAITDLDEGQNRINVWLDDLDARERLGQTLLALGIPLKAVKILAGSGGGVDTHSLSDAALGGVLEGGYQIGTPYPSSTSVDYQCTLGFPVERTDTAGITTTPGFITAGHCTEPPSRPGQPNRWDGGVDGGGANFYQPNSSATLVGREVTDPDLSSSLPGCPAGKKCRRSDSAFVALESGINYNLGAIAKPLALGGKTLRHSAKFRIVRDTAVSVVGQTVEMVGKTTGWVRGQVTHTCVRANYPDYSLLCQHATNYDRAGGDSGAPVFKVINSPNFNDVHLVGIHIGWVNLQPGVKTPIYSPINYIYGELGGSNYTWKACDPAIGC